MRKKSFCLEFFRVVISDFFVYIQVMEENKDYKYYLDLGITETNKGNFDEALVALDKALELNPTSALIYFSKAAAFFSKGDVESAYDNFSKSIELDKNMIDAYYNRALIVLSNKQSDKDAIKTAEADLAKAVELDAKFVDAYYYLAVARMKLEDYKGAVEALDKSLELEPEGVYSKALKKLLLQKYLR